MKNIYIRSYFEEDLEVRVMCIEEVFVNIINLEVCKDVKFVE